MQSLYLPSFNYRSLDPNALWVRANPVRLEVRQGGYLCLVVTNPARKKSTRRAVIYGYFGANPALSVVREELLFMLI